MKKEYICIYNNLVKLTRNKSLYSNLKENDSFSDRLTFLLLHLSFFFKAYKGNSSKKKLQEIHDLIFNQIELSIREIGYGDVSINKNMKKYVNYFYDILGSVDRWDSTENQNKIEILYKYINKPQNISFFLNYFDKLSIFYKNNSLNFFTKDIEDLKI